MTILSPRWRERLASPLTWHIAGFVVLLALAVLLAIRLGLDWAAMDSHSSEVLAVKQLQLKALEIETAPLRGLDQRVEKTRKMRASSSCRWLRACASRACSTRRASLA
jgi:hypothetical protein